MERMETEKNEIEIDALIYVLVYSSSLDPPVLLPLPHILIMGIKVTGYGTRYKVLAMKSLTSNY